MDSESHFLDSLDLHPEINYNNDKTSVTKISLSELEKSGYKGIKTKLYHLVESANNLRMMIKVRNLEKLGNHEVNCRHLMESCQRETSAITDVYMILKSIASSTSGAKIHWIEIIE